MKLKKLMKISLNQTNTKNPPTHWGFLLLFLPYTTLIGQYIVMDIYLLILFLLFILYKSMKLLFSQSFLKKANSYDITIDDLTMRIQDHFHSCTLLCSPLPDTKAYK